MFNEILKIDPQLDAAALSKMENSLGKRFSKIAKKFGKGLTAAVELGGIATIGAELISKVLNPLQDIKEAIDKTLNKGSDIAVQARQFGSTPAELAKLQAFGTASGIDPSEINRLVEKFQAAVSEAVADPTKQTSVRQFVGEKDSVKGFFDYIQGLRSLDKNQQVQAQQEIFGEKFIGRMSEFVQADFKDLAKKFSGLNPEQFSAATARAEKLDQKNKENMTIREWNDFIAKSKAISGGGIDAINASEIQKLKTQNENIKDTKKVVSLDQAMNEMQDQLAKLSKEILLNIPELMKTMQFVIKGMQKSVEGWELIFKMFRGSGNKLMRLLGFGGDK